MLHEKDEDGACGGDFHLDFSSGSRPRLEDFRPVRKEQTHCSCSSILWILVIRTDNRRMGAPEVGGLEPRALSGAGFARRIIMRRQPTNSVPPRAFWGPARLFR
jgi:hypothetical protein